MQFLDLPRELRDAIYTFALCPRGAGGGLKVKLPTRYRGKPDQDQKLALFAVCRQIHAESLPIYYSRNVFYVESSGYLPHLIRDSNAEHIRAISLAPTPQTAFHRAQFDSALRRLSKLEHLELRITSASILDPLKYRAQGRDSLAKKLERIRDIQWLMSMSSLSRFYIKWMYECTYLRHFEEGSCPTCVVWLALREAVEACLRAEVTQPRAPYGQSPTHLARVASQSLKAGQQSQFTAEMRKFNQRMQMELQHPEKKILHEELLLRIATLRGYSES